MHASITAARQALVLLTLILVVISSLPVSTLAQGSSDSIRACVRGGWQTLAPAGDTYAGFADQDECVRYGAAGGTVVDRARVEITMDAAVDGACAYTVRLYNGQSTVYIEVRFGGGTTFGFSLDASEPMNTSGILEGFAISSATATVTATGASLPVTYPTTPCGG